jgi:hypothetical protein
MMMNSAARELLRSVFVLRRLECSVAAAAVGAAFGVVRYGATESSCIF